MVPKKWPSTKEAHFNCVVRSRSSTRAQAPSSEPEA